MQVLWCTVGLTKTGGGRQLPVLFESSCVMGLGSSELKHENWLVLVLLVAGEDSVFLVC